MKGTASLGEHRGTWCNVAFARHGGLAPRRSGAIQIGKTGAGAQAHQEPYKMERKARRQVQDNHNRQSLAHSSLRPFVSFIAHLRYVLYSPLPGDPRANKIPEHQYAKMQITAIAATMVTAASVVSADILTILVISRAHDPAFPPQATC